MFYVIFSIFSYTKGSDKRMIGARPFGFQNGSKLLPYQPSDLWFATVETKKSFSLVYDKYGDHFTENVGAQKTREILSGIKTDIKVIESKNILDIEQRYFPGSSALGLFRRCRYDFVCEIFIYLL